jgi:hypothetical protein
LNTGTIYPYHDGHCVALQSCKAHRILVSSPTTAAAAAKGYKREAVAHIFHIAAAAS